MTDINYYPTRHLLENMRKRKVTLDQVMDVIRNAENRYGPDAQGRTNHQKGELCVVTYANGGILTVLLRQEDRWTDAQMRVRNQIDPLHYCDYEYCAGYRSTVPKLNFDTSYYHARCEMIIGMARRRRA